MFQALNTGHDGFFTTIHANSPREMLSRLERLVMIAGMDLPIRIVRQQISSAVDVIVHMSPLRDGSRYSARGLKRPAINLRRANLVPQPLRWPWPATGAISGWFLCYNVFVLL